MEAREGEPEHVPQSGRHLSLIRRHGPRLGLSWVGLGWTAARAHSTSAGARPPSSPDANGVASRRRDALIASCAHAAQADQTATPEDRRRRVSAPSRIGLGSTARRPPSAGQRRGSHAVARSSDRRRQQVAGEAIGRRRPARLRRRPAVGEQHARVDDRAVGQLADDRRRALPGRARRAAGRGSRAAADLARRCRRSPPRDGQRADDARRPRSSARNRTRQRTFRSSQRSVRRAAAAEDEQLRVWVGGQRAQLVEPRHGQPRVVGARRAASAARRARARPGATSSGVSRSSASRSRAGQLLDDVRRHAPPASAAARCRSAAAAGRAGPPRGRSRRRRTSSGCWSAPRARPTRRPRPAVARRAG